MKTRVTALILPLVMISSFALAQGEDNLSLHQFILQNRNIDNKAEYFKNLLKSRIEDINKLNESGSTPLFCAVTMMAYSKLQQHPLNIYSYFFNITKLLLNNKADPNIPNAVGNMPLHLAAVAGDFKLINLLLKHNANANVPNQKGNTPLSSAIEGAVANHIFPNFDIFAYCKCFDLLDKTKCNRANLNEREKIKLTNFEEARISRIKLANETLVHWLEKNSMSKKSGLRKSNTYPSRIFSRYPIARS